MNGAIYLRVGKIALSATGAGILPLPLISWIATPSPNIVESGDTLLDDAAEVQSKTFFGVCSDGSKPLR